MSPDAIPHAIDLSAADICQMRADDGGQVEVPTRKSTRFRVTASGETVLVEPDLEVLGNDLGEAEQPAQEQDSGDLFHSSSSSCIQYGQKRVLRIAVTLCGRTASNRSISSKIVSESGRVLSAHF